MDRKSWLEFNIRGEVLRYPRKPGKKKYDTLVYDCTFSNAKDLESIIKHLKKPGRILMVVPSKDSPIKFPVEAGKIWDEIALKEVIDYLCKWNKLKKKLMFKCYPEINNNYSYFYIALVRE